MKRTNDQAYLGTIITFSVLLVISLCGIIAIILMLACQLSVCKYLIYLTWFLVSLFTFIGFLVSSFLIVGSIVTSEGCWVMNQTLTNQSAYQEYMSVLFDEGIPLSRIRSLLSR